MIRISKPITDYKKQKVQMECELYDMLDDYYKKGIKNGTHKIDTWQEDGYIFADIVEIHNGEAHEIL